MSWKGKTLRTPKLKSVEIRVNNIRVKRRNIIMIVVDSQNLWVVNISNGGYSIKVCLPNSRAIFCSKLLPHFINFHSLSINFILIFGMNPLFVKLYNYQFMIVGMEIEFNSF